MDRQTIIVDIAPGSGPVQGLKLSQGDIGRPMGVYIIQNGVALDCSAYSAELYILKPDGKFYTTQATVDATEMNLIKWDTAEQETPVAGACAAQIRITAGDDDIGTARFVEFVEASPCNLGSASESEVALLTEYVRQAHESATSAERDATTASGAASSASGSALTATAAANTATQAASAATAAADRAEAVEESIPADYTQLSDDVTGLKSAIAKKSPAIFEEIESVPLATFADGAEDMPLKDLKVAIEPVQDLHGYDHPWPAGGGKNLVGFTLPATMSASATTISTTDFIKPTAGTYVRPSGKFSDGTVLSDAAIVFRAGGTSGTQIMNMAPTRGYLVPSEITNADTVTCLIPDTYANKTLTELQLEVVAGESSPSTVYTPYSNICPISGWTGAKVTRTGKNLLPMPIQSGSYANTMSVTVNADKSFYVTKASGSGWTAFLLVSGMMLKAGTYTLIESDDGSSNASVQVYYAGTETNVTNTRNIKRRLFTVDKDTRVDIKYSRSAAADNVLTKIMLFMGDTATADDYEPYHGETYDITFPSEAGTVYGGTLDVTTGELVVDRAEVDLGGIAWLYYTSGENPIFYGPLSDIKKILIAGVVPKMLTTIYKTVGTTARTNFASHANNCEITETLNGTTVFVRNDAFTDAVTFKNAMSGVQLCYELATPITYQLTPQQVCTLLGINDIWVDTGDVSLLYPADTKAYIDNQIASTRKLIAGIETEFKASKAYAVGDMLIIGNDLYKVSASIASGATITVGTNVTKTTVAEQLIALANA